MLLVELDALLDRDLIKVAWAEKQQAGDRALGAGRDGLVVLSKDARRACADDLGRSCSDGTRQWSTMYSWFSVLTKSPASFSTFFFGGCKEACWKMGAKPEACLYGRGASS